MESNGLEADEPLVKTQMTVTKKEQNTEKPNKKQNDKTKKQTPKTVPNKTLKNDQCRYCEDASDMMADCPELAKQRKIEEDLDAPNALFAKPHEKIAILVPIWIIDHQMEFDRSTRESFRRVQAS